MLSRSPLAATFPVRDLKAAKKFYADRLGLRLTAGSVRDGFLEFRAGRSTSLLLFASSSNKKSGNTGATFEVVDLDKEMEALRKKGVEFEDYDLPGVRTVDGVATMGEHVMAWLADPDGNIVALHQSEG